MADSGAKATAELNNSTSPTTTRAPPPAILRRSQSEGRDKINTYLERMAPRNSLGISSTTAELFDSASTKSAGESDNSAPTTPRSPTTPLAKIPLPSGCKWHAFISHYQATGADQASNLALALEAEGWVVWYDQNADMITVDGMREGIQHSAVFILFLTEGATSRPYVQFEMRTALEAKLPWFLLNEDDPRHGKFNFSEFSSAKTFPLKTVGIQDRGDEPILSLDVIKAVGAKMESLSWRRRGYEKKSLISELTRRYGEREKFIPKFSLSEVASVQIATVMVGKNGGDDELSELLRKLDLLSCEDLLRKEGFDTLEILHLATVSDLAPCGIKRADALRILHALPKPGNKQQLFQTSGTPLFPPTPSLDNDKLTKSASHGQFPPAPRQNSNIDSNSNNSNSSIDQTNSHIDSHANNAVAISCSQCGTKFGLFTKRHRCKSRCRRTLCDKCSPFKAKLIAGGDPVRVCGICFEALTGSNKPVNTMVDTTALGDAKLLKRCVYLKDMDENGAFYFLGTRLGTDSWMDPCVRGFASVCASSEGYGLASSLLSRRHRNRFNTKDERSAWVCVELKRGISITPHAYTLIHGDGWDSFSMRTPRRLRHWRLEGVPVSASDMGGGGESEKGGRDRSASTVSTGSIQRGLLDAEWVTLRNHVNDEGLNGPWSKHTWPLQVEGRFIAFRIVITDKNSLGLDYEITVGGIEIYGDLYDK